MVSEDKLDVKTIRENVLTTKMVLGGALLFLVDSLLQLRQLSTSGRSGIGIRNGRYMVNYERVTRFRELEHRWEWQSDVVGRQPTHPRLSQNGRRSY